MENNDQKLIELETKIDRIYISVEKTRSYLKWTLIITVVLFILPLIGLLFAIPTFLKSYSSLLNI